MRATPRTSRVRRRWEPPAECGPPWELLERGDLDRQPVNANALPPRTRDRSLFDPTGAAVISHLPAEQIAQQLCEVIQDEAGSLEAGARRQVARRILAVIRPWLVAP